MDTTIRILYAEDDADGAKLTKMILEKENFDVEIALNGAKHGMHTKSRNRIFS